MSESALNCQTAKSDLESAALIISSGPEDNVRLLRLLESTSRSTAFYTYVKRVFDFVAALLIIVFIAPVLLALIMTITLSNDGPVFYAQRRVGRSGAMFHCFKFRTMCQEADTVLPSLLAADARLRAEWITTGKLRRDPRVSRVGRLLRATSLDELPQLWNVLCGDMSLVGPRPITEAELLGPYTFYHGREAYLSVRPGITGLWQVSGRSEISYERRVSLDVAYVETSSALKDLSILFKTVGAVIGREGAC